MTDDGDLTDAPAGALPADDAPPPDGDLRNALRDLVPDYDGPADPLLRVRLSIRRRRSRRRALLAVGSAAAAAALVIGVPAVLGGVRSGGDPLPAGADPTSTGPAAPLPPPVEYAVSRGVTAGSPWRADSISPGGSARRCLVVDGAGFVRDLVCFDEWRPGDPLSWYAAVAQAGSGSVTVVAGVAPDGAAAVRVRLRTGRPVPTQAVRTPTDPRARFFAVVLAGGAPVRSVTAVSPDGSPLGRPVTVPAQLSCRPSPDNACPSSSPPG